MIKIKSLLMIFIVFCISFINAQNQTFTDGQLEKEPIWFDLMLNDNPNFFEVKRAYDLYFENHEKVKGSNYKQFERWAYLVEGDVKPDGSLPSPDKVFNEYQKYKRTVALRGPATNAGNWKELGPISYPVNNTGQETGTGRVNALAFHPTDEDIFWVGAPSGGLWKTIDGGTSYTSNTDQMPTLGVSSIVVDQSNPAIIYIGSGDRDGGNAPGLGVFKSVDGGANWTLSNTGMGNRTVGMMIMDPVLNNILLAATSGGIYRTVDSGLNWSQVSSNTYNYKDIIFHPTDPNFVYATEGGRFYRSDDKGLTWSEITSGLVSCSRMVLGASAAEPNSVICTLTGGSTLFQGIYKSTDKGLNFTKETEAGHPNILGYNDGDGNSQAGYDLCMLVNPNNADSILVGSINIHLSIDGGVTFDKQTHWVNNVHADQHTVAINPLNGRVFEGHDGGLHYTDDYFDTYTNISSGLNIAQAYKIGQAAQSKDLVINGYQDNGSANYKNGTFTTVLGGDGMESEIDYDDKKYAYSTYIQNIKRSTNGGYGSWSTIAADGVNGIDENGAWVTPYMLHLTDPNTMFFGYKNIWRTNNVRNNPPTWTKISNNLGGSNSSNYHSIAQSLADVNVFYGARHDKNFFRSDNVNSTTPTWTDLTPNLPSPGGWIDDIICHSTDPEIVYIIQSEKVYKSIDKGNSWTDISGTIPSSTGLNCFVYDKYSNEGIYVGTKTGVYYKDADMADWILFDGGLPVVDVRELEIFYGSTDSRLAAATFGRGLWNTPLYSDPNALPIANFKANITEFNTGETVNFEDLSANNPTSWTWTISPAGYTYVNGTNASSQNPEVQFTSTGVYTVSLQVTNSNGNDTRTIESYISVYDIIAPNCIPTTQNFGWYGMGIYHVIFNTIDKNSGQAHQDNPTTGYLDLITTDNTILTPGGSYNLTVELGTGYTEYWNVYIDYNNDGDFDDPNETVYTAPAKVSGVQNININIIASPLLNELLRMRIICDYGSISGPCDNPSYGQAEDYGLIFKDLPTLTTNSVSNIGNTTAQSGGNITSSGSSSVIKRGVVWGVYQNPTMDNNLGYTEDGSGTGNFISQLSNLNSGIDYNVRAYAINSEGISYGQDQSFTTSEPLPILSTNNITNILYYTATSGGNITNDGGESILNRGVVWDTSPNPSFSKNTGKTEDGAGSGAFTSSINELYPNTTYYVRAYARNKYTISYGDEKVFTTLPPDANQSRDIVFSEVTTNKIKVSWTNGTGTSRIVKINTVNNFTLPTNGTNPTANTVYGGGEQVIFNGSGNYVTVTNLNQYTTYYFIVFDYTGTGTSTVFNTAPGINNPASQITYCLPTYTNGDVGTHIKRFILNTIDNTSSASHYSDYTNISTALLPDNTYDVSFEMSYNQERVSLWIDYNDDQLFDASEKLLSDYICPANVLTTTQITIPSTMNTGPHLLRIRASWNSGAGACTTQAYGEVEDYNVDFKDKITWTGTTDTDWMTTTNWDVGKIPNIDFEVIINPTPNNPNIGVGQTVYAKKITATTGATLTIDGNLNIED